MDDLASAGQLYLAALLAVASVTKLRDRVSFEMALVRLAHPSLIHRVMLNSRVAATTICVGELVVAGWLLVPLAESVRAAVVGVLFTAFLAVVARAWLLHVQCGCFSNRRPSEVSDVLRGAVLAGLAWTLAVLTWDGTSGLHASPATVAWLAAMVAATFLPALAVGAAMRRSRPADTGDLPLLLWPEIEYIEERFGTVRVRTPAMREDGMNVLALARTVRLPVSTLLLAAEDLARSTGTMARRDGPPVPPTAS